VRVTSLQQQKEETSKRRPIKPFTRKNSAQLVVGTEAGPTAQYLKWQPCHLTRG